MVLTDVPDVLLDVRLVAELTEADAAFELLDILIWT